ncbi:MAG TPA: bifunctional phosphoglucose/phosphomannose isomerase, partial [Firmicutes bacterium]|nr:bifunctional phosphoglucose/phosphomannose isomerase [Bacillota bacterium]
FPELNHNETVGWEAPADVNALVHVIILRDAEEAPRLAKRVEVTRELMAAAVDGFTEIRAEGTSALARMFSLVYIGDFVSYYLSMLNGIDPSPVRVIDKLKAELAKLG